MNEDLTPRTVEGLSGNIRRMAILFSPEGSIEDKPIRRTVDPSFLLEWITRGEDSKYSSTEGFRPKRADILIWHLPELKKLVIQLAAIGEAPHQLLPHVFYTQVLVIDEGDRPRIYGFTIQSTAEDLWEEREEEELERLRKLPQEILPPADIEDLTAFNTILERSDSL